MMAKNAAKTIAKPRSDPISTSSDTLLRVTNFWISILFVGLANAYHIRIAQYNSHSRSLRQVCLGPAAHCMSSLGKFVADHAKPSRLKYRIEIFLQYNLLPQD